MSRTEYDLYLKSIDTTTKYYFFSSNLDNVLNKKGHYQSFIEHQLEDIVFLLTIIKVMK